MKIQKLFLSVALLCSVSAMADTEIIAHRGYWRAPGSAQNSLSSYQNADRIGCFGSEIDVWLTKDGVVVVNHDPSYNGVVLETATYAGEVKNLKLANGEKLPTLEEYLQVVKKGTKRLVIEIKTHKDMWRENLCVDTVLELVKKYKLTKRVDYIAFSYNATLRLIEKAPKGTEVYYLNGDKSPQELKQIGAAGPDYNENIFLSKHPEWLAEFKRLGLKVNVWTVDKKENLQFFIDKGVEFITTNEPELLKGMLGK